MKPCTLSIIMSSSLALMLTVDGAAAQPAPPSGQPAGIGPSAAPPGPQGAVPFPPPPEGPGSALPAPPGPRADRSPPPPPRGPSIRIERDAGGALRLDVHCGEAETAKSCADTTLAVLDKVNGSTK